MKEERCPWASDPYDINYHDEQWGKPLHDEQALFEMLILEGMQAGLSWNTILRKRENFQNAFDHFDYHLIANYSEDKVQELLGNAGIIRNRLKIRGTLKNAQAFLNVQKEFGSFDHYIWSFVNHTPIVNHFENQSDLPTKNELSDQISKDMKKRGFTFVGSTIIYSFMEAIGMINDHMVWCKEYHNCQNT